MSVSNICVTEEYISSLIQNQQENEFVDFKQYYYHDDKKYDLIKIKVYTLIIILYKEEMNENNKFKKLAEISLSGESYAVRGLYIDNYFYIVNLGKDVKVLDLNNYKVVKKLK